MKLRQKSVALAHKRKKFTTPSSAVPLRSCSPRAPAPSTPDDPGHQPEAYREEHLQAAALELQETHTHRERCVRAK